MHRGCSQSPGSSVGGAGLTLKWDALSVSSASRTACRSVMAARERRRGGGGGRSDRGQHKGGIVGKKTLECENGTQQNHFACNLAEESRCIGLSSLTNRICGRSRKIGFDWGKWLGNGVLLSWLCILLRRKQRGTFRENAPAPPRGRWNESPLDRPVGQSTEVKGGYKNDAGTNGFWPQADPDGLCSYSRRRCKNVFFTILLIEQMNMLICLDTK